MKTPALGDDGKPFTADELMDKGEGIAKSLGAVCLDYKFDMKKETVSFKVMKSGHRSWIELPMTLLKN